MSLKSFTNQENINAAAFYRREAILPQVAPKPQRNVLGVLSENDQHKRSFGQGTSYPKNGSDLDNSLPSAANFPACIPTYSSSGFEIYVDDHEESMKSIPSLKGDSATSWHRDTFEMQHKDFHLLLECSAAGSCMDASMHSLPDCSVPADLLAVVEYSGDIHQYLRESEVRFRPKISYMKKQPDITNSMRVILVDWLVEVGEEYKLRSETLYLAVNYLDRFLSCMAVLRGKLQLVGTAAVLLASKYEEIYPPEVDEFVYITDDTYTKKQVLRMEHLLLKVLAFDLTVPTINQFLNCFLKMTDVCSKTENLALYVAELSLMEVDPFLKYLPSQIAAAAYCLANYTINRKFWPVSLTSFTGYTLTEVVPCLSDLHKMYLSAESLPQQAIREKYKSPKYLSVSLIIPPEVLPLQ
ncbi:cyclin-A1 [Polyodon spathula]|uniref:cyclin-A1 n=1 Tax=Polyodon spathula TaxID=7913 RepID=UPI001B7F08B7|nr:cyclin-A1 [Polyodon spathula]